MRRTTILAVLLVILVTATAHAESLKGTFGIYGKGGALVPLKDDFIGSTSESKTGFATGGGLVLGLSRNVALEVDVTHVPRLDTEVEGTKAYKTTLTDVALGLQYRFASSSRIVPYAGAGVDFITGDLKHVSGSEYKLDWTEGGHVNLGVDFFLTRYIALTAEARGVLAFEGDVSQGGTKVGEYRPTSFIGTLGLRLIVPHEVF